MKCLPSRMPELRTRVWDAFKATVKDNSLQELAEQMGVDLSELPELPMGEADLEAAQEPRYMLH